MSGSNLHRLRVLETHQLPGTLRRVIGDAGLVLVGLLAWWALPFQQPGSVAIVAGTVSLLLACVLLLSGHNARLTRRDLEST